MYSSETTSTTVLKRGRKPTNVNYFDEPEENAVRRYLIADTFEEKNKISDNYCCGIYGFMNSAIFIKYCKKLIEINEFYLSQIYKLMIEDRHPIKPVPIQYTKLIDKYHFIFYLFEEILKHFYLHFSYC